FVNALQKAWRSGDRLRGSTSDLVTMIKTMSGITLDPGLSPRGTWPTDSGSAAKQKMQRNMIAAAIRTTAISTAVHAVTTLKQPRDVPDVRGVNQPAGTGRDSGIITVMHPALDGVQTVSNGSSPPNYEDLKAIRTALNAAIDQEQLRIRDDVLFQQISVMRTDLNRDISARLAQVERTALRTPDDVLPALVLAAAWYDDAGRESDILTRNPVPHPGFIPVEPLRVPVR
ncbi:DNA circularization protein, partial [Salmonella enterica subsp. enterica serovar Anatum]|nr:DNA circularization protein [Salmonella enterica subsp. enterica serovar Anatum]